jgi:periplasmic protein TonB
VNGIKLPLALSIAGHAVCLALLVFFLSSKIAPPAEPIAKGGIEVAFEPALPQPEATPPPRPEPETLPPPAEPPPPETASAPEPAPSPPEPQPEAATPAPEPPVAAEPAPEAQRTVSEPTPPPPRKLAVKKPPKPVPRRQEVPQPSQAHTPSPPQQLSAAPAPAPTAPQQTALAATPVPAPVPSPEASAGYRALLSAWLESHKRYPESARQRSEEGHAVLRFQVDRSGRVLDYAVVSSSGYPDLDQSIDEMMRGAILPPFPAGMPQSRIEVSVTIRFSLRR